MEQCCSGGFEVWAMVRDLAPTGLGPGYSDVSRIRDMLRRSSRALVVMVVAWVLYARFTASSCDFNILKCIFTDSLRIYSSLLHPSIYITSNIAPKMKMSNRIVIFR